MAFIGSGAVAEMFHLPASRLSDKIEVTMLVDQALERARQLAARHRGLAVAGDFYDVIGKADAALIALPNYLHAAVAVELLRHGVHVLVEKPMAITARECDDMIEAASESGATLAIGLIRRFYESSRYVKRVIESGILGPILSFDLREGKIFRWAAASDAPFRKESSGGGVLVDIGSHVLDLLLWWLGDYDSVEYYDDAQGGVEADCELYLRMKCGVAGTVELSRTRNLRNTFILRGERGTLELESEYDPIVRLIVEGQEYVLSGQVTTMGAPSRPQHNGWPVFNAFREQFDDFAAAVSSGRAPFVPGAEGRQSVELIEECYAVKQPLQHLWLA